jgi:hypothetical protein
MRTWGECEDSYSPHGPFLLDIEVTDICDGIGNHGPCKFCYKSNTLKGNYMTFDVYKNIFDKLIDVMQPQFADEDPCNPFDFWEGAEFKLKIRNVEGYRNYDKSEFSRPSPLLGGDDSELEQVYEQLHDLREFEDEKNYKTYEELSKHLAMVLGQVAPRTASAAVALDEVREAPRAPVVAAPKVATSTAADDDDDDNGDTMSYFAKLAAEE